MPEKFQINIQIRFKDLDSMNHVNNAVYLTYFEQGRLAFFRDILNAVDISDFSFIVASASVNYYYPIFLNNSEVILKMWAGDFGNKSFKFFYEIFSKDEKVKFADGATTQVFYDYNAKKTVKVPAEFIEKIKDFIF